MSETPITPEPVAEEVVATPTPEESKEVVDTPKPDNTPETDTPANVEGGKRKPSEWNLFVKKVYGDEKKKNKSFKFKDALVLASKMMKTKSHKQINQKIIQILILEKKNKEKRKQKIKKKTKNKKENKKEKRKIV